MTTHKNTLKCRIKLAVITLMVLSGTYYITSWAARAVSPLMSMPNFAAYYSSKSPALAPEKSTETKYATPEAYKEAALGYEFLEKKQNAEALKHFLISEKLDPNNAQTALQIAYLLNELGRDRAAYYQFAKVAVMNDPEKQATARQAMINLAGLQTKILPKPFFADFYISPYYISRFNDFILPAEFRLGFTYGKNDQGELYLFSYFSRDTQSRTGDISEIYADNFTINGIGTRYQLFKKLPIFAYADIGYAHQFVYDIDSSPQNQFYFRGGINAFKRWGRAPRYAPHLARPFKQIGEFYGDFGYYTIYEHNWLGELSLREGLRVMEYKYSAIDVYLRAHYFFDTKGYFYNNLIELGPGIAFIPDNRLFLTLRAETVWGHYIPTRSPEPNPYRSNYGNTLAQLEAYWQF